MSDMKKKEVAVSFVTAIKNSKNQYVGKGSKVRVEMMDGSTASGVIVNLMYGGDVKLSNGLCFNVGSVSDFALV